MKELKILKIAILSVLFGVVSLNISAMEMAKKETNAKKIEFNEKDIYDINSHENKKSNKQLLK